MDHFLKAISQYGIKEIKGINDNPEVLKYFDEIGFDGKKMKDETAWCSAFVNWCCKVTGYEFTGKLNARSWLNVGINVELPAQGDIVILWRENPKSWKGHVGFFVRETNGFVYILGGNQNNQVSVRAYPKKKLIQYKRLKKL
ncbi:TIGR02594 family protein [Aquimarina sp. 2201CG14-23]|uniref:TIGR02594 family protein n=1 Tax=Aquimarina mycalae TaxID=3040073 RepID=UPI002477EF80|nr:TIGR02594 family protein [Aquimarina sp. 2201CG14-23]MDH7444689.1 TIGR02594 family protein [Aquimarina sp. 2201CG14-23]